MPEITSKLGEGHWPGYKLFFYLFCEEGHVNIFCVCILGLRCCIHLRCCAFAILGFNAESKFATQELIIHRDLHKVGKSICKQWT